MVDLAAEARLFRTRLNSAKKAIAPDFEWYPYDSLSNVSHLTQLLGSSSEDVWQAAAEGGVLDLGCGDGDLSFLFESLGYRVTAFDYPVSNHNCMRGIWALQRRLQSRVSVQEVDVDSDPLALREHYGLTLFLGTLYHLKNPYSILDRLARHSRYCVMSTRVARCFPGGTPIPHEQPIAYLLAEDELNRDDSNFWIFSNSGLRRLIHRTGWEIIHYFNAGDTTASDPTAPEHDERVFCLLKSHYGLAHLELLDGWHDVEAYGCRWTKQRFQARMKTKGAKYTRLTLQLFAPPALIENLGELRLNASINGTSLQPATIAEPGAYTFERQIRDSDEEMLMSFCLDKALLPDDDPRERGIIVASLELT
jgi:tRNA (mo5U34)-methyltransferase